MKARQSVAIRVALGAMGIQAQIKVACVGTSITAGAMLSNAGLSPHWTTSQFKDVFAYKPAIITLCLGTNDARATQWNRARYIADYKAMIDTFSTLSSKPRIWLVKPMPASDARLRNRIDRRGSLGRHIFMQPQTHQRLEEIP